jgi:hypothetical protein
MARNQGYRAADDGAGPMAPSNPRFAAILAVSMVLAAGVSACGGPLDEGKWLFDAGRYPQAKQALASLERESASWDGPRQAEYALYRGLTYGALGDWARAERWLATAKAIEDGRPRSLSPADARRLDLALTSGP